jgi:hypothetical protein
LGVITFSRHELLTCVILLPRTTTSTKIEHPTTNFTFFASFCQSDPLSATVNGSSACHVPSSPFLSWNYPSVQLIKIYEKKKRKTKQFKRKDIEASFMSFLHPVSHFNFKAAARWRSRPWRASMSCSWKSEATSGESICRCRVPAPLKTSFIDENFGRLFYCCVNYEVRFFF